VEVIESAKPEVEIERPALSAAQTPDIEEIFDEAPSGTMKESM
jgi:hypothetical protein